MRRAYACVGVNRGPRCVAFASTADGDRASSSDEAVIHGEKVFYCGGDGVHAYDVREARVERTRRVGGANGAYADARCVAVCGEWVVSGDSAGRVRCERATTPTSGEGRGSAVVGSHARGPVRDASWANVGGDGVVIVLTCADDGDLIAWRLGAEDGREEEERAAREVGRVSFPSASTPLCVDLTPAPGHDAVDGVASRYVMAVGCVDGRVRVYACDFTALATSDTGVAAFETCGTLDGHADWVRGVSFAPTRSADAVFLATASQDRSSRVWRIQTVALDARDDVNDKEVAPFMRLAAPPKPPSALLVGYRIKTSLESLLIGHEDWVMSVAWHPDPSKMVLMTASMDRSLMLWSPTGVPSTREEAGSELWMATSSLGEAAAVCLGYYGASFSPDGNIILANSHGGALHVWRSAEDGAWQPITGNSGHTMEVTCLQWDTAGRWLMSGGQDQTTRIHAPWRGDGPGGWRQIARPQVHGHDIVCFATMPEEDADTGTITYVSGGDEKVLRVFEAPGTFLGTMVNSLGDGDEASAKALAKAKTFSMESLGAELPALGLSNKALRGTDTEELPSDVAGLRAAAEQQGLMEEYNARGVEAITPQSLSTPPLEEVLAQATLWPEIRKLYGHGNEIRAVAAHCKGDLIASASNALTSAAASVWIWSRNQSWKPLGTLEGATLTVTALEFTPSTARHDCLLAASRDRHVCLFAPRSADAPRGTFDKDGWRLVSRFKAHDREIYAAAWAPCGTIFATAGRDKKVKTWRIAGEDEECRLVCELPKFCAAPTSIAFSSKSSDGTLRLAVGLDNGVVEVHTSPLDASAWSLSARVADEDRHGSVVRAVAWRPNSDADILASCADDNAVHVYDFNAR